MGYPGITRACKEVAYDNGGINRDRSEAKMERQLTKWLAGVSGDYDLGAIDAWLKGLSDEDMNTVCCGEETEQQRILESAPPFTWKFMCQYFDEVC